MKRCVSNLDQVSFFETCIGKVRYNYINSDVVFPGLGHVHSSSFTTGAVELMFPDILRGILSSQGLDPSNASATEAVEMSMATLVLV